MNIEWGNQVVQAYERQYAVFRQLQEEVERLFAGTKAENFIEVVKDAVDEVQELNRVAGWLPQDEDLFDEREALLVDIKHDRRWKRRFKTMDDVPPALREHLYLQGESFEEYAQALRENAYDAHFEIREVRSAMEYELDEDMFFDELFGVTQQAMEDELQADSDVRAVDRLLENLKARWAAYMDSAYPLLHAAIYVSDTDYDQSFIDELIFR